MLEWIQPFADKDSQYYDLGWRYWELVNLISGRTDDSIPIDRIVG